MFIRKTVAIALLALLLPGWASARSDRPSEVEFPASEWKKLDTFENHSLLKADKSYEEKKWRQAVAEYDAFLLEFPRSAAVPYVLLRKGRCWQQDGKVYKAIEAYKEVLDYFPNAIEYAGAALFWMGDGYWSNGELEKAMKAWVEMANDEDYRHHFRAAQAIIALADNLTKQGELDEAMRRYEQVAVDFWRSNNYAARSAYEKTFAYYIRTRPDESALRRIFEQTVWRTDSWPDKADRLEDDRHYWSLIKNSVKAQDQFDPLQADLKKRYLSHWIKQMKDKFKDWDEWQINVAQLERQLNPDAARWTAALDRQYQQYASPGDYGRILLFMQAFKEDRQKVDEYYALLNLSEMTYEEKLALMVFLYDIGRKDQARNVIPQFAYDTLNANQVEVIARALWHRDGEMMDDVYMRMEDKLFGMNRLLYYYYQTGQADLGLPLAEELIQTEKYAQDAWSKKAALLQKKKQYEDALSAYQMADNPPGNLWGIVACYEALGQTAAAVAQATEIENFFDDQAPKAALRIADLYLNAGEQAKYISSLRAVLKKYPRSSESSEAHQRLEDMGIRIGGAIDAK